MEAMKETLGSRPEATSAWKSPGKVGASPFWNSGEEGSRKREKYSNTLFERASTPWEPAGW